MRIWRKVITLFSAARHLTRSSHETIGTLTMLLWGLWVVLPWDTFRASPAWRIVAEVLPEALAGWLWLAVGTLSLVAFLRDWRRIRAGCAVVRCGPWTLIAVGLILAAPTSTGAVVYPMFALGSAWTFLTVMAEWKRYE